jgi:hypothetical protein
MKLLSRVFKIDVSVCSRCQGPMRIVRAVSCLFPTYTAQAGRDRRRVARRTCPSATNTSRTSEVVCRLSRAPSTSLARCVGSRAPACHVTNRSVVRNPAWHPAPSRLRPPCRPFTPARQLANRVRRPAARLPQPDFADHFA